MGSKYPDTHFTEDLMVKHLQAHKDNIRDSLRIHGSDVKKRLVNIVKSSRGTGRKYPQLPNRSSAPGEYPVSQSGKLVKGFGYRARVNELLIYNRARSKTGAPYPAFLNDGTRKMEPRQYFDNTIEAMAGLLEVELQDFDWFK